MVGETSDFTSFLCCVLRIIFVCSLPIAVSRYTVSYLIHGFLDGLQGSLVLA